VAQTASPDRYDPLPRFPEIPRWLWNKLSPRGKVAAGVAAVVLAAGGSVLVASMVRRGDTMRADEAHARREAIAARRRELIEDQRPRYAVVPRSADPRLVIERGIDRDVRARVRAGKLPAPAGVTTCTALRGYTRADATRAFNCFNQTDVKRSTYVIQAGFRFDAKADLAHGRVAWCKNNPRPLHPDTAHFVTAPISKECRP
jgi:hypothetical protein